MRYPAIIHGFVLVVGVATICIGTAHAEAVEKDEVKIQGTWKLVSLESDGEPAPPEIVAKLKLLFRDKKLEFAPGEPGFSNYTFELNSTTKPASFDMTHVEGTNKGKTTQGIYKLEGDELKICFGQDDERPQEFTAKAESGQTLYVLKREKP